MEIIRFVRSHTYRCLAALSLAAAELAAQSTVPGIGPGAAFPRFSLPDQTGKSRTFNDIRGPRGAMLVFYRSADW
jgi:hypothetical protein